MQWPTFNVIGDPERLKDPAILAQLQQSYDATKHLRSEVIEAALFVESQLTLVLGDWLSGSDQMRRDRLRAALLDTDVVSFMTKWKILGQLLDDGTAVHGVLEPSEAKTLRRELHQLVSDRNKFAHGDLYARIDDGVVVLQYYEGGPKEVAVDEALTKDILSRAESVHEKLWRLHEHLYRPSGPSPVGN